MLRTERTELNSWGEDTGVSYDSTPGFEHKMRIKPKSSKEVKRKGDESDGSDDA